MPGNQNCGGDNLACFHREFLSIQMVAQARQCVGQGMNLRSLHLKNVKNSAVIISMLRCGKKLVWG